MQIPGARDIPGARSSRRACSHFKRSPLVFAIPGGRMNSTSGGLRPTVGLRRPGGGSLRRRRPTPGAERLEGPISIGTKAFGRRSACAPNEFGLEGPSADGRPAPTEKRSLRRRRPTPGAERLEGPISIGTKAFGRRSACAPTESASRAFDGRPAPTEKLPCVGGGRRLARSALRGRFQSAQKPSADGRPVRRMNSASRGLRPTVGLCRPKSVPCVGGGRRLARSALRGRFQSAQKPSADGRPVRRMNSASGPSTVGLCRPKAFPASAEADAWRAAP
jgi:hypothetical protein